MLDKYFDYRKHKTDFKTEVYQHDSTNKFIFMPDWAC